MLSREWEEELKWFATGRYCRLSRTECRCSRKRSPSLHLVSPMYSGATLGTADTIDHISGYAGEHMFNVEGFLGAWDGSEGGEEEFQEWVWDGFLDTHIEEPTREQAILDRVL
eukprot:g28187.t1